MSNLLKIKNSIKKNGYCDLYFDGEGSGILSKTTRIYGIEKNSNCKASMYQMKYIGGEICIMGKQIAKLVIL